MEGICVAKSIVVGICLKFGLFKCKTRGSCVYNKTTEKKGSFCNFIVRDITNELMR